MLLKAVMAHHEEVLTGELNYDSLLFDAGLTDAVGGSRLVPARIRLDRVPGYARLRGDVSSAGDVVGS